MNSVNIKIKKKVKGKRRKKGSLSSEEGTEKTSPTKITLHITMEYGDGMISREVLRIQD